MSNLEATRNPPAVDDMPDNPERWPLLAGRLQECHAIVDPVYQAADAAAMHHQKHYRQLVRFAAIFGALAITVAIVELICETTHIAQTAFGHFLEHNKMYVGGFEAVMAVGTVLAVIVGLWTLRLDKWLVERYKAERCRLLKFGVLIDPALWSNQPEQARLRLAEFQEEIVEVQKTVNLEESTAWLATVHIPQSLTQGQQQDINAPAFAQLIEYYLAIRLRTQINYFATRIKRFARSDYWTKVLPQWCFFLSVVAALVHFALVGAERLLAPAEANHAGGEGTAATALHSWLPGLVLTGIAALLPAWGAGLRTIRMAHEFGRNVKRFESAEHFLNDKLHELEKKPDLLTSYRLMWECEHYLENEHREWLRLMSDTEWFG